MNAIRTAVLTATVTGLTLASLATATAAAPPAPKFLAASQLPAASTPWTAEPVRTGLPEYGSVCTAGVVPASGSSYREFRTELDTTGRQTTTVAATTAKAKTLVTKLNQRIAGCLDRLAENGIVGEAFYHGRIAVEEGADVYNVDTSHPEVGTADAHLISVGRDGRTVTVLEVGHLGWTLSEELAPFRTSTRTAVAKLY
ncbi:hypothetical protein [Streptomyces sp. NPDC058653]|uniref:hypothetical protein n=1 Tax=Streptomyces sp. NPDC058653 TaxID=3346576 RepID=UPI00364AE9BB